MTSERMHRECEAFNCASFAPEEVSGNYYCPRHARIVREKEEAFSR